VHITLLLLRIPSEGFLSFRPQQLHLTTASTFSSAFFSATPDFMDHPFAGNVLDHLPIV
jgi:hypothetical protein